jgi:membrane-bound lytic murein transglycosylase MltF
MTDKFALNVLPCRVLAVTIIALATLIVPSSALPAPVERQTGSPVTRSAAPGPTTLSTDLVPWKGDWDGIVARHLLRVLVSTGRTFYFVDKGTQRGITYDIFKGFEDEINQKLKTKALKFHVAFIPVARDQLIPALLDGRGDVAAANLTVTEAREKLVAFSEPLLTGVRELVVTGPQSPALKTLDDLSGQEIYVRKSSSYWEHLEALNARFIAAGRKQVKLKPASENLEDEDLLEMLNAGLVRAVVVDSHKAMFWAQVFPKIVVHEDIFVHEGGDIAWALREHSPQLKAALDDFIKTHGKGTMFGNTLLKRYWQNAKYVKDATNPEELKKFEQTVALFRKYAAQYDMDYLLMMAQGYQESRLDQSVKSRVGAVGVMQVMPTTAKELNVGDITELEPNVNAGVKYIRYMIDTYYAKEPMDPLNKALFAFASYNAGPARIQSLRTEAAKRGLDPNQWFQNVALVAAEKIGQETVTYVANIYKYYIAYKLLADQEEEKHQAREAVEKSEKR